MLSIGIVGLPNVGKSTLFNALTQKSVPAENFPFCTIDPSVGIVSVPDERLEKLSRFSESAKTIPAAIEFVDIAGLVSGAHKGEGLGNQFLSHIREVDAILQMVRIFKDKNVTHVSGELDPINDIRVITLELILADLQTVEKRLSTNEKLAKRGDKEAQILQEALLKVKEVLEGESRATAANLTDEESVALNTLRLLTRKPILYALNKNTGGENIDSNDARYKRLIEFFNHNNLEFVEIDAKVENDLRELEGKDRVTFRKELDVSDDGVNALIQSAYTLLGLQTFFTTGPEETRAWTIPVGATAPRAGAAIHTDFEEKFIRADIIGWELLLADGSWAHAREMGHVRTEGKDYIVSDGDVIIFKI